MQLQVNINIKKKIDIIKKNAVIGQYTIAYGSWKNIAAKNFQKEEEPNKLDKERNSNASDQVLEISNPAVTFLSNSKAEIPSLKTEGHEIKRGAVNKTKLRHQ